jgi:hypothetical protein
LFHANTSASISGASSTVTPVLPHQRRHEPALAVEALDRPHRDVGAGALQRPDHPGVGALDQQVVAVGEGEVLTGRVPNPLVAGGAEAGVGLVDHAHPRVTLGDPVGELARAVGGAVVDDDHLERMVRLLEDAGQAVGEVALHVVGRHHDAQQGGGLLLRGPAPSQETHVASPPPAIRLRIRARTPDGTSCRSQRGLRLADRYARARAAVRPLTSRGSGSWGCWRSARRAAITVERETTSASR